MSLFFEREVNTEGVILRLIEKPWLGRTKSLPVESWAERMADQAFSGVSRVLALLEDDKSTAERRDDGVFLDHVTIASLTEPQALALGLPPSVKVALQIETKNLITEPEFRIVHRWIGLGNRVLRAVRTGSFLSVE